VPIWPDPIYDVIEQHQKAAPEQIETVRIQLLTKNTAASKASAGKNTSASSR
jgi:hypothetical protein